MSGLNTNSKLSEFRTYLNSISDMDYYISILNSHLPYRSPLAEDLDDVRHRASSSASKVNDMCNIIQHYGSKLTSLIVKYPYGSHDDVTDIIKSFTNINEAIRFIQEFTLEHDYAVLTYAMDYISSTPRVRTTHGLAMVCHNAFNSAMGHDNDLKRTFINYFNIYKEGLESLTGGNE